MVNKIKTPTKLYLLIFIMTVFIIGIGVYGISEMNRMEQDTKTIYNDRVFPLQQLATVRFSYISGILSAAERVKSNEITFGEGENRVEEAQKNISVNWNAYMRTYLTPEEKQLAKQTTVLMNSSTTSIEKLKKMLNKKDAPALDSMIRNELYPAINPVIIKTNELVNLQVGVGGEVYKNSSEIYETALEKFILLIILSLIFAIPFSYYLVKSVKNLIENLRESNKKIIESEMKYHSLIDHAADAIFMVTDAGIIFEVNRSASDLLMYTKEELTGRTVLDLHPSHEHSKVPEIWDTLRENKSLTDERKLQRKDGSTVDVEISRKMLPDASGAIAIVRDITERKKAEEYRDKLLTDLTHRYNELMQFNYIVSHNLRAPLANIIGLTQLFAIEQDMDRKENAIRYIKEAAARMDDVIHDLTKILALQTPINEKKEIIDLRNIIHAITETLNAQINISGITITISIAPDANNFMSIKAYFESILYNLISNSIKYRSRSIKSFVIIEAIKKGDEIIIKVEDNGIGIDLGKHREKVFGLYSRFNTETEGKGLGLFMTKLQVESLGGHIQINSTPVEGTTFTITLKTD